MVAVIIFIVVVYILYYIYYFIKSKVKKVPFIEAVDPDYKRHAAEKKARAEKKRKDRAYQRMHPETVQKQQIQSTTNQSFRKPKKAHYVRNTLFFGLIGTMYTSHKDKKNRKN